MSGWPAGQVTSSTSYPARNLFQAFRPPAIAPHRADGWVTASHSRLIPAKTQLPFSLIVSLIERQQISTEFFPMLKKLEPEETDQRGKKARAGLSWLWTLAS